MDRDSEERPSEMGYRFKRKQKPLVKLTLPKEIYVYPYYTTRGESSDGKKNDRVIHLIDKVEVDSGILDDPTARNLEGVFVSRRRVSLSYFLESQKKEIALKYSGRFIPLIEPIDDEHT